MVTTTCLNGMVQEAPKPYVVPDASVSEGGFAPLLSLLTGVGTDRSAPVDASELPIVGDGSLPHAAGEAAIADTSVLLFVSGLMPVSPPMVVVSTPAFTPVILEGGREPVSGAGAAIDAFPAPTPPISLFSATPDPSNGFGTDEKSGISSIPQNISLFEYYVYHINKVQENGININSTQAAEKSGSSGPDMVSLGRSFADDVAVQEIDKNLNILQSSVHAPATASQGEGNSMGYSETHLLRHEKSTPEAVPSMSEGKLSIEHLLPLPTLQTAQMHSQGVSQLTESTAVSHSYLYEQVAQPIEWLVAHREEQSVHLRLDPPELGALEIRIHVEGNAVHAWLTAERDLTRQSLEQQAQQLREQLASRGLQLAHFEVNTGSQGAFERARYTQPSSLPLVEPLPRPQQATDSLHLFGQWSAWA